MNGNFTYYNPTKVYFGSNALKSLKNELSNYGSNVLLVYGSGSIIKSGLFDDVLNLLTSSGKNVMFDGGVMANPTMAKLLEGIEIGKSSSIDLILAVGGGSVIDYAKTLAVALTSKGDVWTRFFINQENPSSAGVPVGCILTLAGTGSEMNGGSVMTNEATKEKIAKVYPPEFYPQFAILDPIYTLTLPDYQLKAGIFDIMSHLMEQYFSGTDDNVSDYLNEGLMRSLITNSKVAVRFPNDYEARSNIMWTATLALNGLVGIAKDQDWMVHMIGHAISGVTDATHGMTLSSVTLPYFNVILPHAVAKFKKFATNVWQIPETDETDLQIAMKGLKSLEEWMKEIGVVLNAGDLGVTINNLELIVKNTLLTGEGYKEITSEDVTFILKESMSK